MIPSTCWTATPALAADPSFHGRVLPTFPPGRVYQHRAPGVGGQRRSADRRSSTVAQVTGDTSPPWRVDRRYFVDHGAVSADHGVRTPATLKLDEAEAEALLTRPVPASPRPWYRDAFEAHMMYQMARMSVEDGLVMTIHPGLLPEPPPAHVRSLRRRHWATTSRSPSITPKRSGRCCRTSALPRTSIWCCSRSMRPSSPANSHHWQAFTPRSTSGRPGGSLTPRMPCSGSAQPSRKQQVSPGHPGSSMTPAPSAPSPPGTTPHDGSRPRSWHGSLPSTASVRTAHTS